jgi:hypothetical protein
MQARRTGDHLVNRLSVPANRQTRAPSGSTGTVPIIASSARAEDRMRGIRNPRITEIITVMKDPG